MVNERIHALVVALALCGAGPAVSQQSPRLAFRLAEHDLYPESIAYDSVTGDFFLGSMGRSRILRILGDGSYTDLVGSNTPGLETSVGLKADAARRRLWVCTGRYVLYGGPRDAEPRTGVLLFDLDDGELLQSWLIAQPTPSDIFNDLALAPDGSVYVTTTLLGRVYHITAGSGAMEILADSTGMQTNGIALGPKGRYLFFTFDRLIRRMDLTDGTQIDVSDPGGDAIGTDGLYLHDGSLVAVQPRRRRVVRLDLNEAMDSVAGTRVVARDHPDFAYPTTGVIVRDTLFLVATSFADHPRTAGDGPQHGDVLIQAWPLSGRPER
ncbi:MAG: SMP-30/gluconolactonase/LRE family protein [Gemmatimonadota bacterium]